MSGAIFYHTGYKNNIVVTCGFVCDKKLCYTLASYLGGVAGNVSV